MIITTDGTYNTSGIIKGKSAVAVYISGEFGGAVAYAAYIDDFGNAIPLEDGGLATGEQIRIDCGVGLTTVIVISGTTGTTNISLKFAGIK